MMMIAAAKSPIPISMAISAPRLARQRPPCPPHHITVSVADAVHPHYRPNRHHEDRHSQAQRIGIALAGGTSKGCNNLSVSVTSAPARLAHNGACSDCSHSRHTGVSKPGAPFFAFPLGLSVRDHIFGKAGSATAAALVAGRFYSGNAASGGDSASNPPLPSQDKRRQTENDLEYGMTHRHQGEKDEKKPSLVHIHIPFALPQATPTDTGHSSWCSYQEVSRLQEHFQRKLLAWKARNSGVHKPSDSTAGGDEDKASPEAQGPDLDPPPEPTLITFTPVPVYTQGRRQHERMPDNGNDDKTPRKHILLLEGPLTINPKSPSQFPPGGMKVYPSVLPSPRGGLSTYHGPGQLVCFPILDLKSPLLSPPEKVHTPLSVRTWVAMLEDVTIEFLARRYGIASSTDAENPGVWTGGDTGGTTAPESKVMREQEKVEKTDLEGGPAPRGGGRERRGRRGTGQWRAVEEQTEGLRKIAALGVHLRRNVTNLGVAINITSPPTHPSYPIPGIEDVDPGVLSTDASLWPPYSYSIRASPSSSQSSVLSEVGAEGQPTDEDYRALQERLRTDPWSRFTPCGIPGRGVTSVAAELALSSSSSPSSTTSSLSTTIPSPDTTTPTITTTPPSHPTPRPSPLPQTLGSPQEAAELTTAAHAWALSLSHALGLGGRVRPLDIESISAADFDPFSGSIDVKELSETEGKESDLTDGEGQEEKGEEEDGTMAKKR